MTRASRPVASTIELVAVLVVGADEHGDRALDVDVHERQAEAALLEDLLVAAGPFDLRVDERDRRAGGLDAVDEQAVRDPDLRGGKADPERVLHERCMR